MILRKGLTVLGDSSLARRLVTGTRITRALSQRFVPGESVSSAVEAAREANAQGLKVTVNYLGEYVRDRATARAAADTYLELLERIEAQELDANVSLKLTQMGQYIDAGFFRENLGRVLERARAAGTFVRFDMESSDLAQPTLDAFEELWAEGWRNTGVVLQAYLYRTAEDVRRMIDLGARVRLCKGAYAEPPEVAYQEMPRIRAHFEELARWLLERGNYPAIATHDELLIDAVRTHADREGIDRGRFEFQLLHGVRRDLQQALVRDGYTVRVYIPFGEMWYPYLMRRMAERPENLWFMVGSVVRESPLGAFLPGGNRKGG